MSESLVIEAVRKTVTVDCVVEEAFRVVTADAMSWWPVGSHSIHADAVTEIVRMRVRRYHCGVDSASACVKSRAAGAVVSPFAAVLCVAPATV